MSVCVQCVCAVLLNENVELTGGNTVYSCPFCTYSIVLSALVHGLGMMASKYRLHFMLQLQHLRSFYGYGEPSNVIYVL